MSDVSYCYIHDKEEEVDDDTLKVCFECGHVYATEGDLAQIYDEVIGDGEILFCPLCLHDW